MLVVATQQETAWKDALPSWKTQNLVISHFLLIQKNARCIEAGHLWIAGAEKSCHLRYRACVLYPHEAAVTVNRLGF